MKVEKGHTVKVHYKGTLSDGTVFDSSEGRDPLTFTIGQGQVIPGFEKGIEGMDIGETRELHIPCAEAYGEIVEDAVVSVDVGQRMVLVHPETGEAMPVTIVSAENGVVQLNGNHPLAGENLNFEITLESIES